MGDQEETEDRDWPELLSDMSVVGGAGLGAGLPRLKRGQGSRHLGVDMTFNPDDEEETDQRNKYFTSSGNTTLSNQILLHRSHVKPLSAIDEHTLLLHSFNTSSMSNVNTQTQTEAKILCPHRRGSDQAHPGRRAELLPPGR